MNSVTKVLIWFAVAWAVIFIIYFYSQKKASDTAVTGVASDIFDSLTGSITVSGPAPGSSGTTTKDVGGATVTEAMAATIRAIDKRLYDDIGWNGQFEWSLLDKDQNGRNALKKFGALHNTWEILKWTVRNTPDPVVPQMYNDYGKIDGQGRYYLSSFGVNYYLDTNDSDRVKHLNYFIGKWQKYANYQAPTDGQTALFALKVVAAMVVSIATENPIPFVLLAASDT